MPQEMTAFYRFACLIILFRKCLTEVLEEGISVDKVIKSRIIWYEIIIKQAAAAI